MIFTAASRMVLNILLKDFEGSFSRLQGVLSIAVSPILDYTAENSVSGTTLTFKTALKDIPVFISFSCFPDEEENFLYNYISSSVECSRDTLSILLKKDIQVELKRTQNRGFKLSNHKVIIVSLRKKDYDEYISLYIPVSFFRLFSKNISNLDSGETVEQEIIKYFKNPEWMLPDIRSLLNTIGDEDIRRLINQLQMIGLLTPYQLYLAVLALPELSLKIKSGLSKNIIQDIMRIRLNAAKLNISSRDIYGGIYSIEEGVYRVITTGINLEYSRFLSTIRESIRSFLNMEFLMYRGFDSWIGEIKDAGLLHRTFSLTGEGIIARSLSRDTDALISMISDSLSERKLDNIISTLPENPTLSSVIDAQCAVIRIYRELKMKQLRPGPESFEYMLVRFERETDYLHLLLSVGWFTLSTALKNVKRGIRDRIIAALPHGAGFLIEDVLMGIANPNIIQDEMQISRAGNICVREIIRLYQDGIIRLS